MKHKFFIKLNFNNSSAKYHAGPNSLQELLHQFNEPAKVKSQHQMIMDSIYKEKFAELELDFLKNSPDMAYHGSWKVHNPDGTMDIDFVPCLIRPEVLYCGYGKN